MIDYALIFLTGLFGSMHCVGMCGAIVAAYSTQPQGRSATSDLLGHLTYNAGRVLSYVLVGGLLGGIGAGIGGLEVIGEWFSTLAGVVLFVSGLWMLRLVPHSGFGREVSFDSAAKNPLLSLYSKTYGALLQSTGLESRFYIGLLTPLLPCGLLYSMFLKAAAAGNAINGALTMAVFGSGIVPSLVLVGFVSTFFRFRLRRWGDTLAGVTIMIMGIAMFLRGIGFPLMMSAGHHQ